MITKTFEVRDRGTFVPVLAIKLEPADERDRFLLGRAGFGTTPEAQREYVILYNLVQSKGTYDVHEWGGGARTMPIAHAHIIEHFDTLENGSVVCVEHILGERTTPKTSEQVSYPLVD